MRTAVDYEAAGPVRADAGGGGDDGAGVDVDVDGKAHLVDAWTQRGDAVREQIDKVCVPLGREAGPDALVVRGNDSSQLRKACVESAGFHGPGD
jgi:hypothetical protein